ncbi:TPA: CD3337/EF1877 family mobilome membrane protein [Staphylococcus aureus]
MKKIVTIFLVSVILFASTLINMNFAIAKESPESPENTDNVKVERFDMGAYKNDKPTYQVDSIDYDEQKDLEKKREKEKESLGDKIANVVAFVPNTVADKLDDAKIMMKDTFFYGADALANMIMKMTQTTTEVTLTFFHFANDAVLLNAIINTVDDTIGSIAGVDGNGNIGGGVFGSLLQGVLILVLFSVTILMYFKNAPIEAIKGLVTPIICLTIAVVFISNMSPILKNINQITNDVTSGVVNVGSGNLYNDPDLQLDSTEDLIHYATVYKTYMLMQYGTDDPKVISKEEAKKLLLEKNAKERKKIIKQQYVKGNDMVAPDNVTTKVVYGLIGFFGACVLNILIVIISFVFIILQFIIIALCFFAPFALLWACLPNQFPVLKNYFGQIFLPFLYKIVLSIMTMVLMILIGAIYKVNTGTGIIGFGISTMLLIALFITLFVFRHKITNIFSVTPEGAMLKKGIHANDWMAKGALTGGAMVAGTIAPQAKPFLDRVNNKINDDSDANYGDDDNVGGYVPTPNFESINNTKPSDDEPEAMEKLNPDNDSEEDNNKTNVEHLDNASNDYSNNQSTQDTTIDTDDYGNTDLISIEETNKEIGEFGNDIEEVSKPNMASLSDYNTPNVVNSSTLDEFNEKRGEIGETFENGTLDETLGIDEKKLKDLESYKKGDKERSRENIEYKEDE